MGVNKKRSIIKAFIEPQLGCCSLTWMLHSRKINNKINRIHEKALRITYNDKSSSFGELLNKNSYLKCAKKLSSFGNRNTQSQTGTFSTS